jgi:hypothetical protein
VFKFVFLGILRKNDFTLSFKLIIKRENFSFEPGLQVLENKSVLHLLFHHVAALFS